MKYEFLKDLKNYNVISPYQGSPDNDINGNDNEVYDSTDLKSAIAEAKKHGKEAYVVEVNTTRVWPNQIRNNYGK